MGTPGDSCGDAFYRFEDFVFVFEFCTLPNGSTVTTTTATTTTTTTTAQANFSILYIPHRLNSVSSHGRYDI